MSETRREARAKSSSKRRAIIAGVLIASLALLGGGGYLAWNTFEPSVRRLFDLPPPDFVGEGAAPTVLVSIGDGDYGDAVAQKLFDAGVTKSFEVVYETLLADSTIVFFPGTYEMKTGMSAAAALKFLTDPDNRKVWKVTIPEGLILPDVLAILSEKTGVPLADFEAVASDTAQFRLPENALSLEGYLFPATYEFEYGATAHSMITAMVKEMNTRLTDLGVALADRYAVITLASIIQREAGSNPDDFGKVGRVFTNRLNDGWKLQSDATVAYGTGNLDTVWTTDAERADASNLYNTYVHEGLPVGPIGAPGDVALQAAITPTDGPWYFFVPINLKTGETVFSVTAAEHGRAVGQLQAWCRASEENAAYCE
ncbi:MAG: endolytic transglycosylase MltG [Microbacteriaceae bacterium]